MTGITLDTGALIAAEKGKRRILGILQAAALADIPVYVPATALAEFWRAPSKAMAMRSLLAECHVLPLTLSESEALGVVLGRLGRRAGPLFVDASVALFAALHAPVLYTSDPVDLTDICARAGLDVRVLGV